MSCAFQEAGSARYLSWPLLELCERSPCIIKLFLDLLFVVILVVLGSIPERLLKESKQAITCWVLCGKAGMKWKWNLCPNGLFLHLFSEPDELEFLV